MIAPAQDAPGLLRPGFARRLGSAFCLALLGGYLLLAGMTVVRRGGPLPYVVTTDLVCILSGAAILEQGQPQDLYDRATQTAVQTSILHEGGLTLIRPLPFIHLPFEALGVALLHGAGLAYVPIFVVWTLISLATIGGSLVALVRGWPLRGPVGMLAGLAALTFFPVYATLLLGQSSAFLLLGWAAGSLALRRGHDGWAGAILALAAIKPQVLPVLLLVLLIMRRWRALAGFAGTLGGAIALTLPFLGWDWPVRYARLALSVGGYPPDPTLNPAAMQNWRGLVVRLLGDTAFANLLVLVLTGLSVVLVILLWWRPGRRVSWQPGTLDWNLRWAGTLIGALLATPYVLPHDLILAIVPGWILTAQAVRLGHLHGLIWLWVGWFAGLAALFNDLPIVPAALWMALTLGFLLHYVDRTAALEAYSNTSPTLGRP